MTLDEMTAAAVGKILDAAPSSAAVDEPVLCGGWHPKMPWVTCARATEHLEDAGSWCIGIEARTGGVYSWFRIEEALRGPLSAGTAAPGGLTPAAPGSPDSGTAGGAR
jgi:hypothetical protein